MQKADLSGTGDVLIWETFCNFTKVQFLKVFLPPFVNQYRISVLTVQSRNTFITFLEPNTA